MTNFILFLAFLFLHFDLVVTSADCVICFFSSRALPSPQKTYKNTKKNVRKKLTAILDTKINEKSDSANLCELCCLWMLSVRVTFCTESSYGNRENKFGRKVARQVKINHRCTMKTNVVWWLNIAAKS